MSLNYIITAKHYCTREGAASVKDRIAKRVKELQRKRGYPVKVQFDRVSPRPVRARIELGQWVADCECRGVEFVDPDEPIFFCFGCANRTDAGMVRPVEFPPEAERKEIERLVLERPVDDLRGLDDLERAHMASALIYIEGSDGDLQPLTRTWNAGEPISNLLVENEAVSRWKIEKNKKENKEGA